MNNRKDSQKSGEFHKKVFQLYYPNHSIRITPIFLSLIIGLVVLTSLISCSTSKEHGGSNEYKLQLVDSIVVNIIGNINISDYCRKRDVFLMFNDKDQSIVETNNKGNIINRLQLNGNEEKQYGQSAINLSECVTKSGQLVKKVKGMAFRYAS